MHKQSFLKSFSRRKKILTTQKEPVQVLPLFVSTALFICRLTANSLFKLYFINVCRRICSVFLTNVHACIFLYRFCMHAYACMHAYSYAYLIYVVAFFCFSLGFAGMRVYILLWGCWMNSR